MATSKLDKLDLIFGLQLKRGERIILLFHDIHLFELVH